MGYQFLHVECYSRTAGAGKAGGRTLRDVVAEAERDPAASPHIAVCRAPILLHGVMPSAAAALAEERAAMAKDASGRRFRRDGLCLLGGVVSYPETWETVEADAVTEERWQAWEAATVDWLQAEYGDRLTSVVRHEDEGHPHLHFYAVPELGDGDRMRIGDIHAGRRAAEATKAAGDAKGTQNEAYKAAMRAFQGRYWESVGLAHGLTRLGPGRRRLTRAQWRAEQVAAASTASALRLAEAATSREARATAVVERARVMVAAAKTAAAEAHTAAEAAEAARRRAEASARQQARAILARAHADGQHRLAAAEARAAPLRRLGGRLGALWSGFRAVEAKLTATAAARVAEARKAAADDVARAKEALRAEAGAAVQADLAALRQAADKAERNRQAAEARAAAVAEEASRARSALITERAARATSESERERFRGLWAEADNALQGARPADPRPPGRH